MSGLVGALGPQELVFWPRINNKMRLRTRLAIRTRFSLKLRKPFSFKETDPNGSPRASLKRLLRLSDTAVTTMYRVDVR